ncbi:MAG: cytochrome-c oxidase, cbb3-type subunit III [Burkholderiaceae bacterium]
MSDFFSSFWSFYVAGLTLVSVIGCAVLLLVVLRKKIPSTQDDTTGHVWDEDLRELNTPMPRWWVGLFLLTIVFAIVYLILYPGLGTFKGALGWSQVGEYREEVEEANEKLAPLYARFEAMPIEQIAADRPAMAIGDRLFINNCSQCHGSDARGSKGFPNLTDRDWIHGGKPDDIIQTLQHGRNGNMPPMAAAVGGVEDVRNVAQYVLSLSGSPHDPLRAQLGKSKFTVCAACHGVGGKGNPLLGAPNLADDIWLHGYGEKAIIDMVNNGKVNQMPAQQGHLTDAQIRVLAAWVWGLSNNPPVAQQ